MRQFPLLLALILLLALTHCNYYSHNNPLPFFAQRIIDTLSAEKQPVKVELDLVHKQLYWLNQMGEIYRIQPDGTQVVLVNKGFGADIGITFIKDFSLNAKQGRIYFTDIFDLESGCSAIKQSDLNGDHIKTITTFDQATPLQITAKPDDTVIYYVTQTKQRSEILYQLGAIQEDTQEKTILHVSNENINLHQWLDFSVGSEFESLMMASQ